MALLHNIYTGDDEPADRDVPLDDREDAPRRRRFVQPPLRDVARHTYDGPRPEVPRDEHGAPTVPCPGWEWPEDEAEAE